MGVSRTLIEVIVYYHGNKVNSSIKLSHAYQRARQRSANIHYVEQLTIRGENS